MSFQFDEEGTPVDEGNKIICEFQEELGKLNIEDRRHPELRLQFNVLARFFTRMSQIRGRKKTDLLATFANHIFKKERGIQIFPIMRMLIPFQDRDRGVYKLQEKSLAKLFHQALGCRDDDYKRMANYKHASMQPYGAPVGDFAMVVHSVIDGFQRKDSVISVNELDLLLDELVRATDSRAQLVTMTRLLQRCTADEMIWVIRIILKDLKLGIKYEKVLELYHPDAADYYNSTSSLREVCTELADINKSLKNVFRLFNPIRPMLAGKKTPEDVKIIMLNVESLLIETKFDGERIQCHFTADQLRFFTRNSVDYTHIYKDKMAGPVREAVQAYSAILDGEIVVLDRQTHQQVRFGLNKPVARDTEDDTYELCYKVFDVLFVQETQTSEGRNMMQYSLQDRKRVLQKMITQSAQVQLVQGVQISTFEDLIRQFDQAIENNEEGIIIKQLDSLYLPNERSAKWIKMKGDYIEDLTDNFDLLIVGGYFGTHSHRVDSNDAFDRITHFLVAMASKITLNQPSNSVLLPFTKVGTGFTDNELSTIRAKLRPFWVQNKPTYLPVNWNPGANDRPDIYIDNPAHSIVFEIKAAEITQSNTFPTDYTLRFPRCVKIRWDKEWHEMMTIADLNHMINETQYTKNGKRKAGAQSQSEDDIPDNKDRPIRQAKQRKQLPNKRQKDGIMPEFRGVDVTTITQMTQLFKNREFCVVNITELNYDKQYIETLILQHGGRVVQNYIPATTQHLISSSLDFRIDAMIEFYPITVTKPSWIIECVRRQIMVNLAPRFILFAPEHIRIMNFEYYDQYGDSYTEDLDEQSLLDILEGMQMPAEINQKIKNKLDVNVLDKCTKLWLLKGKSFYLFGSQMDEAFLCYLRVRMIARGAEVRETWDDVEYVVMFPNQSKDQDLQLEEFLVTRPYVRTTNLEKLQKIIQ